MRCSIHGMKSVRASFISNGQLPYRYMRNLLLILSVLLFSVSAWAQELILQGHVVDAETGEVLPYATVYVSEGRGTLTNADGEFKLKVQPQDLLTFSYVGYEKLYIKAAELPNEIKMKAFQQMLREVTVKPVDDMNILEQVIKNLKQDYSKHKKERQGYFLRALMQNQEDSYLIECFLTGRSAVNLREAETLSGMSGMNAEGKESSIGMTSTNIHRLAEIGACTYQSTYWQDAIKPLSSMATIKKYYKMKVETIYGSEGEKLYRITFRWNNEHIRSVENRRYLTGTAFVDVTTLHLLRFEGEVGNAYQWIDFQRTPTTIKFHINYDYTKGYAAISNLGIQGGNEKMNYRCLLFNIQDDSLFATSTGFAEDNILNAVDKANYDSTLWERYNIVKRTKDEERAAFSKGE